MPPVGPLLKNDGPACRVCGCTENNACVMIAIVLEGEKKDRARETTIGCSWVETSGNDTPRWLCSACSGTEADMVDAIRRGCAALAKRTHASIETAIAIGNAALMRRHRATHVDRGRMAMAPAKKIPRSSRARASS